MGYLAKPHPSWSTAPVRVKEKCGPGGTFESLIIWETFEQRYTPEGANVPGDGRCCPVLQTSLPPSTPPRQAKASGGLGSGA